MVQMQLYLDYKRNEYVVEAGRILNLNKHDTILQCIDRCMQEDLEAADEEESLQEKEFKDLQRGGVN